VSVIVFAAVETFVFAIN